MKDTFYQLNDISNVFIKDGKITSIEEDWLNRQEGASCNGLISLVVTVECSYEENSYVRHKIWLPNKWNGIFLGVGNGGSAGKFGNYIYEATKGYAVAQTDMGTYKLMNEPMVLLPDATWTDYGNRATHKMVEVANTIILARYGVKQKYSYFSGGSAGGLQAFSEFQNYPEDFDGIIARVPSNNALCLRMYFLWCFTKLRKEGYPLFTKQEKEDIYNLVLEFFSGYGKVKNGYVTWGWIGEDTVDKFIKFVEEKRPNFTKEQMDGLRALYEGPVNPRTKKRIFCGMPFGAEINSEFIGNEERLEQYGSPWFRVFFGEKYKDQDFDFDKYADIFVRKHYLTNMANNPNIQKFKERGGKIICYSGGADPLGPWPDAMNYYNRVCNAFGGYDNVKDFFKYFVIPGRAHGESGYGLGVVTADENGGSQLDMLRAWRENGVEPKYLYGTHVENVLDSDGNVIDKKVLFGERIYAYKGDLVAGKDFQASTDEYYLNGAKEFLD